MHKADKDGKTMKEIKVAWHVEDGFANNGTHYVDVYVEDFEGMTPDEIKEDIYGIVSEEFSQRVSSSIDDITGVVAEICDALNELEQERAECERGPIRRHPHG